MVKNLPSNAGDIDLIPGSRRSPGEGSGNPLPYFCLENPMDRGAWQALCDPINCRNSTPTPGSFMCMCVLSLSVVSDSLQAYGLLPTRLLCPWDFSGKKIGVGCHFQLQEFFPIQGLNPCLSVRIEL